MNVWKTEGETCCFWSVGSKSWMGLKALLAACFTSLRWFADSSPETQAHMLYPRRKDACIHKRTCMTLTVTNLLYCFMFYCLNFMESWHLSALSSPISHFLSSEHLNQLMPISSDFGVPSSPVCWHSCSAEWRAGFLLFFPLFWNNHCILEKPLGLHSRQRQPLHTI